MGWNIILVGIGSMLGGMLRYLVAIFMADRVSSTFPYGTLTANLTGCFLIGVFFALSEKGNILTPEWRILLTTGFCGGFTTLSTFSYESIKLIQDGELLYLSLNVFLSILVGFGATYLGMFFVKSI